MPLSRRGKRRAAVLALVIIALAVAGVGFRMIHQAQQQRLMAEARASGIEAYRQGNLELALQKFEYFAQNREDDLELNMLYAEAQARNPTPGGRHLFDAVDRYAIHVLPLLEAMPATPDVEARQRDVLGRLLNLYSQIGDRRRVEMTADALLEIDPNMIEALAAKGEVEFLSRRFDDAGKTAQRLIELDPDNMRWRRTALQVQTRLGASTDALVEQCHAWAEAYPGDARVRLLTAATLVEAARNNEARSELDSVAGLGADSPEVLEQLVSLLDALGLRDEGDAAVAATQQRWPKEPWVRETAVRRLWQDDRIDEALSAIESAQRDSVAETMELSRLRVLSLVAAGRRAEALTLVQPMMQLPAADQRLDADRAWARAVAAGLTPYEAGGAAGWRQRIDAIQAALAFTPNSPVLHALLGDASLQAGEYSGAVASFSQARTLAPNWIAAGLAYGEVLRLSGRLSDAFEVSRGVFGRAAPTQPGPFLLLARCAIDLREAGINPTMPDVGDVMAEVITVLRQARDRVASPQDSPRRAEDDEVATLLVRAYLVSGNADAAADLMRQAMAADSGVSGNLLVAFARASGDYGLKMEAALLDRAREVGGLSVSVALAQARLLAADGRSSDGLHLIDNAISSLRAVNEDGSSPGAAVDPQSQAALRRAVIARAAYLTSVDPTLGLPAMMAMVSDQADSIDAQQFILAEPLAWRDPTLIARAMANLKRLLGEGAVQVRLAEANFLIRNHAAEPAMLARAVTTLNGVLEEAPDSLAALTLAAEAEASPAGGTGSSMNERATSKESRRAPGNLDRAVAHLEHATALYPGEPHVMIRLIALLQRRGRFDDARRYLERLAGMATRDARQDHAFAELRLLEAQGDFEAALVRASALVNEQSPPPQQLLLALIEERAGRSQTAEAIYQRLLSALPPAPASSQPTIESQRAADDSRAVLSQAAEFFAVTGRFEKGVELIARIAAPQNPADGPSSDVLVGAFFAHHGRLDDAERLLRAAVQHESDSVWARDELARCLLMRGDSSAARDEAVEGLRLDGQHLGLRSTLAIANLGGATGSEVDRAQAIKLLRDIGAGNDGLLAMLELLEAVPSNNGQLHPTTQNLLAARQMAQQYPAFLPVWQLAISLHVDAGRRGEAIAIAREAVSALPGQPQPSEWATRLLIDAGRWDDAMAEAREWIRRSQSDPLPAECAAARTLLARGRATDALTGLQPHAERIVAERSMYPAHLGVLIEAMLRGGNVEAARQIMIPLLTEDRRWRQIWIDGAEATSPAEAERMLTEVEPLVIEPEDRLSMAMRWLTLSSAADRDLSLQHAQELAKSTADEPTTAVGALIVMGGVAELRGDLIAAERHYYNALNKAPNNAVALNNLASVLSRDRNRAGEALPLAEKATRLQPDQPDFLDTYAAVLLALDRPADAVGVLRRALDLRPEDPAFMLALAGAHLGMNEPDDAALLLDRVQRRPILSPDQQEQLKSLRDRVHAAENIPSAAAQPTSTPE